MNPNVRYPDRCLVVPPYYCGPVKLYALMSRYGCVAMDFGVRWDKRRKQSHRTVIAGANGVQRLTVPIVKPDSYHGITAADIEVSDHGQWWALHRGAIESAYGRTPYYEYYADELVPAFDSNTASLKQLDLTLHRFACRVLGINDVTDDSVEASTFTMFDDTMLDDISDTPYWQVWQQRYGFQPGLSVLDLIFSLGPTSPLYFNNL